MVTGQQAGLLGGPLYTIYKALGALHHAAALESATGFPVIPVFWVASDDHDFAEVARHHWLDARGNLQKLEIPEDPTESAFPISERRFPREQVLAALDAMLAEAPAEVRDALRSCCDTDRWEEHFVRLLLHWLGPLGLVPVVPRLGFLRRRAIPVLAREIQDGTATSRELMASATALHEVWVGQATIHRKGDEANFFLLCGSVRARGRWRGSQVEFSHPVTGAVLESMDVPHLLAELERSPGRFSPNVALRPLVQDAAFATVGYVAGPGELVYHAQIGPLYKRFGIPRPIVFPRPSLALVDPRVARGCEKLGLTPGSVLAGGDAALEAAARAHLKSESLASILPGLDRIREEQVAVNRSVIALTRDTGVLKAADQWATDHARGAQRLRERLEAVLLQQDATIQSHVARVRAALLPEGQHQERVLGLPAPALARAGEAVIASMAEAIAEGQTILELPTST